MVATNECLEVFMGGIIMGVLRVLYLCRLILDLYLLSHHSIETPNLVCKRRMEM